MINIKKTSSLFVWVLLMVSCATLSCAKEAPKLKLATLQYDLGNLGPKHRVQTIIADFTNQGGGELVITDVKTDCDCTTVQYPKGAYLSLIHISGQLEGELGATALGQIYTFGPTFRAENSNTPRHLAEFWMIEPEIAFTDLDDLMGIEEEFIKYCVQWALDNCKDDLEFLNKMIDKTLLTRLQSVVNGSFVRLDYSEGIKILEEAVKSGQKFEYPVSWGMDLASEH